MRETDGRSARIRHRLAITILVLALLAQLLDAVNGVVALVAGVS